MQKQNTHYTKLWPYQTLPALPLSLSPLTRRLSTALATTKTWPVRLKRSRATATALQGRAKQSSSFTVASTIRCSPSAVHLQSICSPSAVHLHSITHSVFTKEAHTHTRSMPSSASPPLCSKEDGLILLALFPQRAFPPLFVLALQVPSPNSPSLNLAAA